MYMDNYMDTYMSSKKVHKFQVLVRKHYIIGLIKVIQTILDIQMDININKFIGVNKIALDRYKICYVRVSSIGQKNDFKIT